MATVLVVDASTSVRETLRIVLGYEHEVIVAPSLADLPAKTSPDAVVTGLPPPPRDERALGAILERELPGVPLLLLHAAHEIDLSALVPPHVPVELLAKPFDAYGVRARVRQLLAMPRPARDDDTQRRWLEFPFLSVSAAAVVRRVLTVDLPVVLVQGETGTGVGAVARALHAAQGRPGSFLALDGGRLAAGDVARRAAAIGSPLGTLFVANLDRATSDVQADLLAWIDRAHESGARTGMIVGSATDLGELASVQRLGPELAYVAGAVPVVLAPLRERTADIPALVETLTREIAGRLRLAVPRYTPAALERLQHYLWFGNVAELEAVVTRTLTLHRPAVVDAEHVVFLPEETPRAVAALTASASAGARFPIPAPRVSGALAGLDLEVVLGELAHELRNPMVTIKTVAQHLDGLLADPEERARFAVLMTEAVGRMDGLLETLLDFARFRAPAPQAVELGDVVERALAECGDDLVRRDVRVERNGAGIGAVRADAAQIAFAFRCLCRGLVPDLVPHSALKIRGGEPGALELQVRADPSVAARVATWVEPRAVAAEEPPPPLAWALAAALFERNGGALTVRKGDHDTTVIRVAWPQPA